MENKALLEFLKKLKKNNNKEWFDKNKKEYDALRKSWIAEVDTLIKGINKFDASLGELDAKSCIFRINRDIRFSNDKSPYKTNFGASINKGGKRAPRAGYYIHIEPGNCFLAGGIYVPEPEALASVRQEIDYNLKAFDKIVKDKTFVKHFKKLEGEQLSRPPKGYDADNAAIEYLKYKSYMAVQYVSDKDVMASDYSKTVLTAFKAMHPLVKFLNGAIE